MVSSNLVNPGPTCLAPRARVSIFRFPFCLGFHPWVPDYDAELSSADKAKRGPALEAPRWLDRCRAITVA